MFTGLLSSGEIIMNTREANLKGDEQDFYTFSFKNLVKNECCMHKDMSKWK